ncbi:MAG: CHASE2 domain-containing protein [Patescibacteria group bacterium]
MAKISAIFLAILGGIAFVYFLFHFRFFWLFDRQLTDKLFISEKISNQVVIIGIDDHSIEELGQWPFSRRQHARLIEKLERGGALAIGYDVTFSERSADDQLLFSTIFNYDNLVFPMEGTIRVREGDVPVFKKTLWPIAEIKDKFRIGHTVLVPDLDGIVRQAPFYIAENGSKVPPFFIQVIKQAGQWSGIEGVNPYQYQYSDLGLFRIFFFGPKQTFRTYSFASVLENDFNLDLVKDKIVLVGATAKNLHDEYFVPPSNGTAMPGVEIQANLIEGYRQNRFLKNIGNEADYFLHLLMLGLIFGILLNLSRPRYIALWLSGAMLVYLLMVAWLFSIGYIVPVFYPLLLMIIIAVFNLIVRYFFEIREKNKIRQGFSQYVAKEVVDQLIKNPEKLNLGGERKKLTVLFSDIRSFTSLAESMPPERLVDLLNDYLSAMGEAVIENNGVIDKFIGDAIMAFWGAPLDNPRQETDALRTALYMAERLKVFNEKNAGLGRPELKIGIGINTGDVIVGNIGSKKRFDYTAIGDEVNLASRLESLTKFYGVQIIASAKTKQMVDAEFLWRYLDTVAVAGKSEGVKIYQLMGVNRQNDRRVQFIRTFERAANIYLGGRFLEASYVFEGIIKEYPDDQPTAIYLERIDQYLKNPPNDFDGVFRAGFK